MGHNKKLSNKMFKGFIVDRQLPSGKVVFIAEVGNPRVSHGNLERAQHINFYSHNFVFGAKPNWSQMYEAGSEQINCNGALIELPSLQVVKPGETGDGVRVTVRVVSQLLTTIFN